MSETDTRAEAVDKLARSMDGIAMQSTVSKSLDCMNAKDAAAMLAALRAGTMVAVPRAEIEMLRDNELSDENCGSVEVASRRIAGWAKRMLAEGMLKQDECTEV